VVLAAVWAASALQAWQTKTPWGSLASLARTLGFLVCTVALVALAIWFPAVDGPVALPASITIVLFVGIGSSHRTCSAE